MASKKGSQLPVATSVGDDDSIIIVTADSPTTKRATKAGFLAGVLGALSDLVDALTHRAFKTSVTVGSANADFVTDGVDDNVQINAALAFAQEAGVPVKLNLSSYGISNPIDGKSGVDIRGTARNGTILHADTDLGAAALRLEDVSDATYSNFTIDGNNSLVAPTFGDNTRNGISIPGTCSNIVIQRVTCVDTPGNGIFSSGSAVTNNIVIRDCETDGAGTRGLYIQSDNVKVFGGHFHNSVLHDGVQFEGCNDCVVIGAHAYGNTVKGFECQVSASNIQFINCQSYDNGAEVANGCTLIDFVNCHVYDNVSAGIVYQQESGNICSDSLITGNTVYRNGTTSSPSGISIAGCSRVNVLGNAVSYSGKHGILLQSGGTSTVTGTYDCVVRGNTSYNNGVNSTTGDGIALFSDSQRNIIEDNFCFDDRTPKLQRYGINISASTCVDNVVRNNHTSRNLSLPINDSGTSTIRDGQVSLDPGDAKWVASFTNTRTSGTVKGVQVKVNFDADAGNNDQLLRVEGATKRWLGVDGNGKVTAEGQMSLGHVTTPSSTLDVVGGSALLPAPATAIGNANIDASQFAIYLDETTHTLKVKWKESNGTVYDKTIQTS
jgi:parallel beta-helix repeat protein